MYYPRKLNNHNCKTDKKLFKKLPMRRRLAYLDTNVITAAALTKSHGDGVVD